MKGGRRRKGWLSEGEGRLSSSCRMMEKERILLKVLVTLPRMEGNTYRWDLVRFQSCTRVSCC